MIVVTGGTGLVGGHLLLKLLERNEPVRVLTRKGSDPEKVFAVWKHYIPNPSSIFEKIEWRALDMANRADLFEALQGADRIYHCAAKISFDPKAKKEMWTANVLLTRWIVDYALENNVQKLVYLSSVAAIAKNKDGLPASENDGWPTRPKSNYSQTKTQAELEVWRGIAEGLNAAIVNPSVIIGPGDWENSSARIIKVIADGMKFYTLGETGFLDVRDVADVLVRLMDSSVSGERFVLNSANVSYRALFEKVAELLEVKKPNIHVKPWQMSIFWRMERLLSQFSGREPRITKESAKSSNAVQHYSSEKIQEALEFGFRDFDDTLGFVVGCLREEMK